MSADLPPITPDTEAWWDATRSRRLTVQRCGSCGALRHYPRALCTTCASTDLALVEVTGAGSVYSFTVVHRAPSPAFHPPYVVALVRLDEGPQLLTNLVDCDVSAVRCEQRVRLAWQLLADGRHLPVFTPAE